MKLLTAYQLVLFILLSIVWVLLYSNGILAKFDSHQWGALIFLSVVGLFAIGICQYIKPKKSKI